MANNLSRRTDFGTHKVSNHPALSEKMGKTMKDMANQHLPHSDSPVGVCLKRENHGTPQFQWTIIIVHKSDLVGGFNPSEKYESQMGLLFPIYGQIKKFQATNQWY